MAEIRSVCPYCGVGCGIVMEVTEGRVAKVSGDKAHSANRGRLCTKGQTCAQVLDAPDRLDRAYVRPTRQQEPAPAGMNHAINDVAQRLRKIIDVHGPDAVALYVSGQMSLEAQYLANKLAKGFIRTQHIESNSRLCMASAGAGYKQSLGADAPPGSYDDFDHADVFFVIGANMADCHPILYLRMMDRVKAGAKLIVVDPRRTATADKAQLYLPIRPGTDLALLNGLLHLIVKNGHTDPGFIASFTEGWDAMLNLLDDYPPGKVAEITGLAEADIRQAAEWIGQAANWMSCWTMGLNQSTHGTAHTTALCNLHLATGAICRTGSGPFSLTGQPNAMGGREMGYMGPGLPGQRSALVEADRQFVEDLWQLPSGSLRAEAGLGTVGMFEAMQSEQIKACWIICTNPVATVPNRQKVIAGLQAAALVITQDAFFSTETNRYADILLPGALWAEGEGVMINSERNLTLAQRAVMPPGDALPDWQIIARVACAMGYEAAFSYGSAAEVFEEIKRAWNPQTGYDIRGVSHERLRRSSVQWPCSPDDEQDRHPIRYLAAVDAEHPDIRFATADGKARFIASTYQPPADCVDTHFPLVLNTGRVQHQWHTRTKTGKVATLNKLNPGPFIEIHPIDAAALGIRNKAALTVQSRRGQAVLPAVLTDRVQPGQCFAPFHWNDSFGKNLAINAVTHDAVDPVSLQPEFKFSAVALTPVAQTPVRPDPMIDDSEHRHNKRLEALVALLGLDRAPAIVLEADEQLYLQGYMSALRTEISSRSDSVPVLPPTAPLAPDKRLLVDGMLAGLFSRTCLSAAPEAVAVTARPVIRVLWASQTGNAEQFAERCAERLHAAGCTVQLAAMDSVKINELTAPGSFALLLTSTFGDGDPPDNGGAFWSALQQETAPRLDGVRFAVLAFGDSNYSQFCGFGRKLDQRLEALGARRVIARTDCEPDYDDVANIWLDNIVRALTGDATTAHQQVHRVVQDHSETVGYDRKSPFKARLTVNRLLNAAGATKETRQFGFELAGSGLSYEAGDALGVWPTNCPALVGDMLSVLKLSASTAVMVSGQGETSLVDALLRHYEIANVSHDALRLIQTHSGSALLNDLLRDDRKDALKQWLWGRQLIDVLEAFPVQVTAQAWLGVLKRLQPRLYSIASSPKVEIGQVQLTVSTVRYDFQGKRRGGVCSTYLADRAGEDAVPIFVQRSTHFRLPKDTDTPIIMVGPGTGVAPFRAFLQERQAVGVKGRNWLLFGEQRAATDFYYRDEWLALQQQGYLHRLDTAFSRDQAEKHYVQHRMLEQGAELWAWLQEGAHFYVCGDASRMAKDVDMALKQVAQIHGGLSVDAAADYVSQMARDKRYLRDVY